MITIKEIADMLGVSTTTVNNVIHGRTKEVSKSTIERVQKVIDEYEYIPNMNARNLAGNQSKIIGVAMNARKDKYQNALKDNYTGELVGSIERYVRNSGYFMMLYISDDVNQIIKYVATWNVDGLILLGMTDENYIKIRSRFKKPIVVVDSYFGDDVTDYVNIGLEDKKGGYEITRYLIECGHKRIAFLADNCVGVDGERYHGYREALKEFKIEYQEEDFFLITPGEKKIELCLKKLKEYSENYTAFFCASDYYAAMIMNYLSDHGKIIPGELSIAGFDDNAYAQIVRPALTTVHQDVTKKGEVVARSLFKLINGEILEHNRIILPVKLVKRNSVKRI